eukprot:COSAG06_NODE_4754_length_3981_cov_2.955458_5_plen_56_part_00
MRTCCSERFACLRCGIFSLLNADKEPLPRLSHNEMDAMDVIANEVDRFIEHSACV